MPSTRATRDIDLYRQGFTPTQALDELIRLASIDLGDHFRFQYSEHSASIGNDTQPYTDGFQVSFTILIGLSAKGLLRVDLAVGAGITGDVTTAAPATALDLPRLVSHPYRIYPVIDQVADKVCATMTEYNGQPSSREKDLVDLVVLAATQDMDGAALRNAIVTEHVGGSWTRSPTSLCRLRGEPGTPGSAGLCPTAPTIAPSSSLPLSSPA